MIEKTILNHLLNNLDCGVYMEKPRNPSERSYVVIELNEVTDVDLNASYNFTDQQTKEYRYQTVFDITHY